MSTVLLFGIMAFASAWFAKQGEIKLGGDYKIVDGDSLVINGQEIRLLGIDAPEYNQICTFEDGEEYHCGKQSRSFLVKLAQKGKLNCTGWEEDKYQRLLAVCKAGETDLNKTMVAQGWALAYGDYENVEAQAKREANGVWQGGFDNPKTWRENIKEAHSVNWISKFIPW